MEAVQHIEKVSQYTVRTPASRRWRPERFLLWTQEAKMLFSELMKVCGDPTFAQRGSADDPNLLLVEKAVSSTNNRRAKWLRVRAKAKARGKSLDTHVLFLNCEAPHSTPPHPTPPTHTSTDPAAGETGWIDPEPEPTGPKRGKGMPTAYQLLGKDEWPITELAEEADELSRGLPGGQPAGPPTGADARAAP